jgi:hypothetical protein
MKRKLLLLIQLGFWGGIFLYFILKYLLTTNFGDADFLATYKFMTPDSYDWIANGIGYFVSKDISFRQPGLPMIIKGLHSVNLLFLLPLLNQMVLFTMLLLMYKVTRVLGAKKYIAYLVVLAIFFNYTYQSFANYILADFYAIMFILASFYCLITKRFKSSFFLLGISWMFQNFAPILLPFWYLYTFFSVKHPEDLSIRKLPKTFLSYLRDNYKIIALTFVLFLNFNVIFLLYKYLNFGSPLFTNVEQFTLIHPNLISLLYYTVNAYTVFGVFFFVVVSKILKLRIQFARRNLELYLLIISLVWTLIFWTVNYEWNDRRFLLYTIPFVYPLLAIFLSLSWPHPSPKKIGIFFALIYSTTVSIGHPLNGSTVPLSNWEKIEISQNTLSGIGMVPIEVTILRDNNVSLYSVMNPSLYELYRNRITNRTDQNTLYSSYSEFISTNLQKHSDRICLTPDISYYEFRAVLYIKEKRAPQSVIIDSGCNTN